MPNIPKLESLNIHMDIQVSWALSQCLRVEFPEYEDEYPEILGLYSPVQSCTVSQYEYPSEYKQNFKLGLYAHLELCGAAYWARL